jgi:MFS family permease
LVDRTESSRALRLASAAQAVVALALATVDGFGGTLALVFLLGAGATVAGPATFTLVPAIAHGDIAKANGALESSRYAGWVLGPIVAGTLSQVASTEIALLVDAASFLAIVLATLFLRARSPGSGTVPRERPLAEALAGIRAVRGDHVTLGAIAVVSLTVVFAAMDNVAEVFFAYDVLGRGAFGLGALATGWLGGMVLGAALIGPRVKAGRHASGIAIAAIAGGACIMFAALTEQLGAAVILFAIGGVANGVQNVEVRTVIHERVSEGVRGRVFAAYSGLITAAQLGATAAAGPIVAASGAKTALIIGGVGSMVIGGAGLVWLAAGERAESLREGPTAE